VQCSRGRVNLVGMVVSMTNRGGGRIILGIDPGTATMGWGVVRQEGNRLSYVQHGAIVTP
jgi:crossover junction endodeoxyribonuclease RuvC